MVQKIIKQRLVVSLLFNLALTFAFVPQAFAADWTIDLKNGESSVEFLAVGNPGFLKIHGKNTKLDGDIKLTRKGKKTKVSGSVSVDLRPIKTGIAKRDKHMKEDFLHIKKYPRAKMKFVMNIRSPKFWQDDYEGKAKFKGNLKIHGVVKKVRGIAEIKRDGKNVEVTSTMKIKIPDFDIKIPSFMGVTVAEDVEIITKIDAPIRQL